MKIYEAEPDSFEEPTALIGMPKGTSRGRKYRYSGPEAILQRLMAFMEDEDYLSLQEEIALARALLESALVALKHWEEEVTLLAESGASNLPKPPVSLHDLMNTIGQLSKLVEKEHNMRYSNSNLITVDSAIAFSLAVASMVNQFVKSDEEREAVLDGIRKILTAGASFNLNMELAKKVFGITKEQGED